MDDLRDYEKNTGQSPTVGLKGETFCSGCKRPCPAEWKQWAKGVLLLTFQCPCGDHFDFTDELEEEDEAA